MRRIKFYKQQPVIQFYIKLMQAPNYVDVNIFMIFMNHKGIAQKPYHKFFIYVVALLTYKVDVSKSHSNQIMSVPYSRKNVGKRKH